MVVGLSHIFSYLYRWNLHTVAVDIHHQEIVIAVIAVVAVEVDVVEYPGALNFVVCILLHTHVLLLFLGILSSIFIIFPPCSARFWIASFCFMARP
jgi:hypothetical protein